MHVPELIVMLTHHDQTVEDACEVFAQCKDAKARYWGFKEEPLSLEKMKNLYETMRSCGKYTALEVVDYTENGCIEGAMKAVECKVDCLMGTIYFDSVRDICQREGIRYMPFVGRIEGRPSILSGTAEEMILEAKNYLNKGVYGIDLLGYRYTGDAVELNQRFVNAMHGMGVPVCIAGSVDSYQRLDELKAIQADYFTIGGAFFEHRFGDSFTEQVNAVYDYMHGKKEPK